MKSTITKRPRPLVLCLLLAFSLSSLSGQQTRRPFGLILKPQTLALLNKIEKAYGHRLAEGDTAGVAPANLAQAFGLSTVRADGVPRVWLSVNGRTESNLVHELMHLDLRSRGFPVIEWEIEQSRPGAAALGAYLTSIGNQIRDHIQHQITFPSIVKMGLFPDKAFADLYSEEISNFELFNRPASRDRDNALAVVYFQAVLRLRDYPKVFQRVQSAFLSKGFNNQMDMGKRMADYVVKASPMTPETEINTFIWCANAILDPGRLEIVRWEKASGSSFDDRTVFISPALRVGRKGR